MSPFFAECSAGAWSFGFKSKIIDRDSATKTKCIVNETTSRKSRTKGGKQRRGANYYPVLPASTKVRAPMTWQKLIGQLKILPLLQSWKLHGTGRES